MRLEFTPQQQRERAAFKRFAAEEVLPFADAFDRSECLPTELIRKIAAQGYLASMLPVEWGGRGLEMISYGLLHEGVGYACSSTRTLLTVHDMVAVAILRWGNAEQRQRWLPKLARGEAIGAFAISEPSVGSDPQSVETTATLSRRGSYILNGRKKWVSFGQIADVFLVLASCDGKPTTFLVERACAGLSTKPIRGMLGVRASMLAELTFEGSEVPGANLLGRVGFGMLSTVSTALGLGRYSVAWGCVGIIQACLDASLSYAGSRKQGGALLKSHQLIRQMLSEMITNVAAARLLCCQAGYYKDANDPREVSDTLSAKYFASRAAMRSALDAVQIHGAYGCCEEAAAQRYMRDAKIMEIIEGSTQIQQISIAGMAHQDALPTPT
jgi:glutaryl-CoA dehydrogenase (non-decarboxylating)